MFLRLAPTLAHWLSLKACPKWPQHFLQIRSVAGPFFMVAPPPSEASLRLRGRGLGLGTGAAPFSSPLHSGNWNAASLVGLLGADTVTWGVGGGSCSTADRTRSGSGNRDRSESTRTTSCRSSPLRRGNRSENQTSVSRVILLFGRTNLTIEVGRQIEANCVRRSWNQDQFKRKKKKW